MELKQLAARLVLDAGFHSEDAVSTAADLVADGVDADAMVQLASQPADANALAAHEIEALFRIALAEVGLAPPSRELAAWTLARGIAVAMVEGAIPPEDGAHRLWSLARDCGYPGELSWMLQIEDAWEESVGADRAAFEAEMLAYAPEVITAADGFLAGDS